jgi:hypothetical protein
MTLLRRIHKYTKLLHSVPIKLFGTRMPCMLRGKLADATKKITPTILLGQFFYLKV